jgi:hypothetical protein
MIATTFSDFGQVQRVPLKMLHRFSREARADAPQPLFQRLAAVLHELDEQRGHELRQ